ncbi:MAG: hypothetical protein MZV63_71100 [Marinilabiliales bacterium]|nr:hypothetical protein [Marinilabiliales bacterium]
MAPIIPAPRLMVAAVADGDLNFEHYRKDAVNSCQLALFVSDAVCRIDSVRRYSLLIYND